MNSKIETYSTLSNLVGLDQTNHPIKNMAVLLLTAMKDWPAIKQMKISAFITDLKDYFGSPLTIQKITAKKFDGDNAWHIEAGNSISELIDTSEKFCSENKFDDILKYIFEYYEQEFKLVDFIAKLNYHTSEQGGRCLPAHSGYRTQIKFPFSEMQTSGQQIFIDKEFAFPGDTVLAKIKILSPNYFESCLTEEMIFEFREGATIIGTGKILTIVNDNLQKISR